MAASIDAEIVEKDRRGPLIFWSVIFRFCVFSPPGCLLSDMPNHCVPKNTSPHARHEFSDGRVVVIGGSTFYQFVQA